MSKRIAITKEWLQALGFTNVTEDGKVFYKGKECKEVLATAKHKYGTDRQYPVIVVYDYKLYKKSKAEGSKRTQRFLLVSRIVYAWFNEICPAEFDVDHIDNNTLNNSLSNLQLLTRKENLARRPARNQYTCKFTEEELKEYKELLVNYEGEVLKCRYDIEQTKEDIKELEADLAMLTELSKNISNYTAYKESKAIKEDKLSELKEQLKRERNSWHFWCNKLKEFKNTHLTRVNSSLK